MVWKASADKRTVCRTSLAFTWPLISGRAACSTVVVTISSQGDGIWSRLGDGKKIGVIRLVWIKDYIVSSFLRELKIKLLCIANINWKIFRSHNFYKEFLDSEFNFDMHQAWVWYTELYNWSIVKGVSSFDVVHDSSFIVFKYFNLVSPSLP